MSTKPPRLSRGRQEQLRRLAATGEPARELAAAFGIGWATPIATSRGSLPPTPATKAGRVGPLTTCRDDPPPGVTGWAGRGRP